MWLYTRELLQLEASCPDVGYLIAFDLPPPHPCLHKHLRVPDKLSQWQIVTWELKAETNKPGNQNTKWVKYLNAAYTCWHTFSLLQRSSFICASQEMCVGRFRSLEAGGGGIKTRQMSPESPLTQSSSPCSAWVLPILSGNYENLGLTGQGRTAVLAKGT